MTARITTRIRRAILWLTDVRTKRFWFLFVVFGPVAYVLSTGPVLWLFANEYIATDSPASKVLLMYLPLEWLVSYSNLFAEFANWYLQLWNIRFE